MANLKKIAEIVGGELQGDPAREITGVQALTKAGRNEIAFVAKGKEGAGPFRDTSRGPDRGR